MRIIGTTLTACALVTSVCGCGPQSTSTASGVPQTTKNAAHYSRLFLRYHDIYVHAAEHPAQADAL